MKKIISNLTALILSLVIIFSSVFITLRLRLTYNMSLREIKENNAYRLTDSEITGNYNILIDYMTKNEIKSLDFIKLSQSEEGRFHFKEVKDIFMFLTKGILILLPLLIILSVFLVINEDLSFLRKGIYLTLLIPIAAGIPMLVNFEKTFTLFHELLFSNDYWIFDPVTDPIILYLPESLFFRNGIIIIAVILVFLIIVASLSKLLENFLLRRKKL